MSAVSNSTFQAVCATIGKLLDEQGNDLLHQPLRLEGWLRDLHPDDRAAISVVMEGLYTQLCYAEGPLSELSATLTRRSGIAPNWADFGMRVWRTSLKGRGVSIPTPQRQNTTQTVEQALSKYRTPASLEKIWES